MPPNSVPAKRDLNVQSTPADNTRKRVWQYIEKEKKERKMAFHWQADNDPTLNDGLVVM